jgi:NAD(P)-dependent dehydrogenase (short-subunit alcohol dehydrogenase family)
VTSAGEHVTIITGAASGIGEGLVIGLAGSRRLVIADLPANLAKLADLADKTGSVAVTADVSNADDVAALVREARSVGPIQGLVNCAGFTRHQRVAQTSVADFHALINVNLLGTVLCLRLAAEQMQRDKVAGSLVAISSINAFIGARDQAIYTAAKTAVNSVVGAAAQDWGPSGIRVNAIAPGSIRTAGMNPRAGDNPAASQRIPMQRVGYPADLVGPVRFLLSDDSRYVTGTVLVVDGGLMLLRG